MASRILRKTLQQMQGGRNHIYCLNTGSVSTVADTERSYVICGWVAGVSTVQPQLGTI